MTEKKKQKQKTIKSNMKQKQLKLRGRDSGTFIQSHIQITIT